MQKHIHIIGIGGIGISALARYYRHLGYRVTGSDAVHSSLIDTLQAEGIDITLGENPHAITPETESVVYSEAIITKPDLPKEEQISSHPEIARAITLGIPHYSYPVALGIIFNEKSGIAVTGSHGKSTTTAMMACVFAHSAVGASVIVGTQVPALGNSNFHAEESPYFIIEACEYKRSFLQYRPYMLIITNIDLDHLDYYRDLDDYISAFQELVDQTTGFVLISEGDENAMRLRIPESQKIIVGKQIYYAAKVEMIGSDEISYEARTLDIPELSLQIPGEHILQDARLVYAAARLSGLTDDHIVPALANYSGSWRRSEMIRTTKNGNIVMSDYGHHPNEIRPTLTAIKQKFPDRHLFVVFQPHQYSRTRELLPAFADCFSAADRLIIPNIYFSRDKQEDVEWMTTERFVETVATRHPQVQNGYGLSETLKIIHQYDQDCPNSSVILLLGAGDVDTLRDDIV